MKIVEPFAGLGAYSLYAIAQHASRLDHRRYRDKPPFSRMGSKSGFCAAVFRAWGLSRQPVESVWLNDLDTLCQALWLSYASADFRDAVAARVAAMTPCRRCQPEAVAAALRGEAIPTPETLTGAEGCPECSGTGVRDARLWWEECRSAPVPDFGVDLGVVGAFLQARNYQAKPLVLDAAFNVAGFNPEYHENHQYPGRGGEAAPRHTLASRISSLPPGVADFAAVGAFLQSRSFSLKAVGVEAGGWVEQGFLPEERVCQAGTKFNGGKEGIVTCRPRHALASTIATLPGPHSIPMRLTGLDASLVLPEGDDSDAFVVLDPPYEATTGYASTSARSTVLTLAKAWHEAGALVLIHEATPLAGELGKPWESRPAGPLRGKASNFWKGGEEREIVTFNRPPLWWPEQQMGLF